MIHSINVQRARSSLTQRFPLWAVMANSLRWVPTTHLPGGYILETAATDGIILWYNPMYVENLTHDQRVGLFAHEAFHAGANHSIRLLKYLKSDDPSLADLANIAADLSINPILLKAGVVLPPGFLYEERFANSMAVESIMQILLRERQQQQNTPKSGGEKARVGSGQDSSGNDEEDKGEEGDSSSATSGGGEEGFNSPYEGAVNGHGNDEEKDGGEGEGLGDQPPTKKTCSSDPGRCGGIRAPIINEVPLTENELNTLSSKWRVTVSEAEYLANDLTAKDKEDLHTLLQSPRVNWREELRDFVVRNIRRGYSWLQPDRRFVYRNYYLPSRETKNIDTIVLAIDTSASMTVKELELIGSEINIIAKEVRPSNIMVIYCSTEVAQVDEFKQDEEIELNVTDRGGTRFSPVFTYLEDNGITPDCCIYLTDMECEDFGPEPPYPVLWASTTSRGIAPWGQVLRMDAIEVTN
jgi:predicted metal-dependent peptidase